MLFSLDYGMVTYNIRSLRHFVFKLQHEDEEARRGDEYVGTRLQHSHLHESLEKSPFNIVGYAFNAAWAWTYWFWTALNAEDDTFRVVVFGQFPKFSWVGYNPFNNFTWIQRPRLGLGYVVLCCILGCVGIEIWGIYELCSQPTPQGKLCQSAHQAGFLLSHFGGMYVNCTGYESMVPTWGDCIKV